MTHRSKTTSLSALVLAVALAGCSAGGSSGGAGPDPGRGSSQEGAATPQSATPAPRGAAAPVGKDGFRSVAVGAGGFVTGISFSDDGATRIVRTDGFGGYRWSDEEDRWVLNVSSESLPKTAVGPGVGGGVLAVAVAPSDGSIVYMAFDDALFRSQDGGESWRTVLSDVTTAPNDNFRLWGSRLAVDPLDPEVVFYGTQLDGLRVTRDGGRSWSQVPQDDVPSGELVDLDDPAARGDVVRPTFVSDDSQERLGGAGISGVAFDRSGRSEDGRTQTVYATSYGQGVHRSTDGGSSWSEVSPPGIESTGYLRVLDNGDVIVTGHADLTDLTGDAEVWRLRGESWTELSLPTESNWRAIATDPLDAGVVAVMSPGGRLAVSGDYGDSWRELGRTQSSEGDIPWLAWALNEGETSYMSAGEIAFDPEVDGRLWFTEGTGVWFADLGDDEDVARWQSQSRGIEQLVPTGVVVPPGGKPVMTAWDRPIFRSEELDTYPTHYGPENEFGSAWSIDWSLSDPEYLVASVASHQAPSDPSTSGFSADGGRTWESFPSIPENSTNAVSTFGFGAMAVSEPGNVVWVPAYGKRPEYTTDGGSTWTPIELPGVSDYSLVNSQPFYVNRQVVAADKQTPGVFYLYARQAGTFRSIDGARTWELMSTDEQFDGEDLAWGVSLKAVPDHEGDLYMTPGQLGYTTEQRFWRSRDAGRSWSAVDGMTGITAFGYGKPMAGADYPAIYAAGYYRGRYGVWRSPDDARSWTFLAEYPTGRTPSITAIDGDKDVSGRVFTASTGGGWAYRD